VTCWKSVALDANSDRPRVCAVSTWATVAHAHRVKKIAREGKPCTRAHMTPLLPLSSCTGGNREERAENPPHVAGVKSGRG